MPCMRLGLAQERVPEACACNGADRIESASTVARDSGPPTFALSVSQENCLRGYVCCLMSAADYILSTHSEQHSEPQVQLAAA
jgi:hypothetical protein